MMIRNSVAEGNRMKLQDEMNRLVIGIEREIGERYVNRILPRNAVGGAAMNHFPPPCHAGFAGPETRSHFST
jgi:hypothetical protein